jgi:hypothetical protein
MKKEPEIALVASHQNESFKRTRWEKELNTLLLCHFPLKSLNSTIKVASFVNYEM